MSNFTIDLGPVQPLHKGDYDPTYNYELNNIVFYDGATYWLAKEPYVIGTLPEEGSEYWKVLVSGTADFEEVTELPADEDMDYNTIYVQTGNNPYTGIVATLTDRTDLESSVHAATATAIKTVADKIPVLEEAIENKTIPIATDEILGKVKVDTNTLAIDEAGLLAVNEDTMGRISQAENNIAGNANSIAILQANKIDKSAISSSLESESEETVASSKAVFDLKNDVFSLAMPDYTAGIQLSIANPLTYTAPSNGYVFFGLMSSYTAGIQVYVNDNHIVTTPAGASTGFPREMIIPLSKNDIIEIKYTNYSDRGTIKFFPCKGA